MNSHVSNEMFLMGTGTTPMLEPTKINYGWYGIIGVLIFIAG